MYTHFHDLKLDNHSISLAHDAASEVLHGVHTSHQYLEIFIGNPAGDASLQDLHVMMDSHVDELALCLCLDYPWPLGPHHIHGFKLCNK